MYALFKERPKICLKCSSGGGTFGWKWVHTCLFPCKSTLSLCQANLKQKLKVAKKWPTFSWSRKKIRKCEDVFFFFFRSIVDDSEMYEQQKPFRLNELVRISAFLNNLVFKMLWNEMVDGTYVTTRRLIFRLLSSNPKKARALRKFSENCMLSWLSDTRIRPKRRIDILAYILLPIVNICSSFLSYFPLEKIHFLSYLLLVKRFFFL